MNSPHFFVWSGGVINLEKVIRAEIKRGSRGFEQPFECLDIELSEDCSVRLEGETIGRFMLHCARYHAVNMANVLDTVEEMYLAKLFPAKAEPEGKP